MKRGVGCRGALFIRSLFKTAAGVHLSHGEKHNPDCFKHQESAPALVPPQYEPNNLRREKKRVASRQRQSRGVFSYYGNHSARRESEKAAKSGEQRLSAGVSRDPNVFIIHEMIA